MPREDWETNTIPAIFGSHQMWPGDKIKSVLDAACGLSLKSQWIPCDVRVGVDIYEPYLRSISADVPYSVMKLDIKDLSKVFIDKSFDCVLLLDVIEHLTKEDALDVIAQAEKIARVCVVLETPRGYIPQNMDILGHEGHEWQTHRCGWETQELKDLGYYVIERDYTMLDIQRHTEITNQDPDIIILDAIKILT